MRFLGVKGLLNALSFVGMRVVMATSVLLGTALVTFGGYSIYEQMYTQKRAFESGIQAFESTEQIEEAQQSLVEEREDYRAWLRVTGTNIDYPVMQGVNDLYYAKHDVDKNISISGSIYMSTENTADFSDNYIVIFGHHMDNGAMFGDIDRYLESGFLDSHQEGVIVTPDGTYDVRFFALVRTVAYEDTVYTVGNRDLEELIAFITANALVKTTVDASGVKKVVALSTCTDVSTNGRLVLFGEMTLQEEPEPEVSPSPSISEEPVSPTPEPGSPTPVISGANGGPDSPKTEDNSGVGRFFTRFVPGGSSYGNQAWALMNLVCLLITLYIVVPVSRLRSKFGRIETMRKVNRARRQSGKQGYDVNRFARRFTIGMLAETAIALIAFLVYAGTENMRQPMILIDKWTPCMLMLLVACLTVDLVLTRNRESGKVNESEAASAETEVRR
ncbi:MAG: class B sortase [Lachnospiraceae bacterium]|nr:class B sortase [Lachnospiraceae bacterium]